MDMQLFLQYVEDIDLSSMSGAYFEVNGEVTGLFEQSPTLDWQPVAAWIGRSWRFPRNWHSASPIQGKAMTLVFIACVLAGITLSHPVIKTVRNLA